MKQYPCVIVEGCDWEDTYLSKGHHSMGEMKAALVPVLRKSGALNDDENGDDLNGILWQGYLRAIPMRGGDWDYTLEKSKPGRGAFPATTITLL